MEKSQPIKKFVLEILEDYFEKLKNSKTFEETKYEGKNKKNIIIQHKTLSQYDKDLIEERANNIYKNTLEPFILNFQVRDFEKYSGEEYGKLVLKEENSLDFTIEINSEKRNIKLKISLFLPNIKVDLFDANLINEYCDVYFTPIDNAKCRISTDGSIYAENIEDESQNAIYIWGKLDRDFYKNERLTSHTIDVTFISFEITKLQKADNKWLEAKVFGSEIENSKNKQEEKNLSQNKGCMFF
jgi:hypothetical protein